MMAPGGAAGLFEITVDRPRRTIRVVGTGFWRLEDVSSFYRQEQAAVRLLGVAPGTHRLLIDARGMRIQSQEVIAAFRQTADAAPLRAARLAFITVPGLLDRQIHRATSGREIAIFANEIAARRYLDQS